MGGGERLTGRRGPLGRRLEYTDNPRTTAVDRRSTPSLGLTSGRTDKNLCRRFGAPACRVFPDHLITLSSRTLLTLHPACTK